MLELCLLGTGGMLPLPYRALTSLMVRYNGSSILIDCGEGTQNQIRLQGWSFKPIDVICITHFHADHISGLPGMLLTMGNAERTEPLTMIGPKGLEHVVNSLRIIAPELPFEIKFIELEQPEEVIEICGLRIRAFRVNHRVTCYGYNIELDRAGKFDAARARALGLPVQYWSLLQKGETVDYEGNVYTSDMVMGSPRKGLKVTYCTDTRPVDAIAECAKDEDLFICEGMYGEEEKLSKAKEKGQYYVNHIRSGFPQPHVLAAACFYYRDYPGGYLFILRRRQCLPGTSSVPFRRAHRYGHGALLPHRLPHRHGEPALKYSYPSSFPEIHGEILHPHYHSGDRVLLRFH